MIHDHADVQPVARAVQNMAESVISNENAGSRADWCQNMVTEKKAEQCMTCA